MSIDNEAYSRREAECERQARAEDSVTDKEIGQHIEAEMMDDMAVEIAENEGESFAGFCEDYAPKTYAKARQALIERAMEVTR